MQQQLQQLYRHRHTRAQQSVLPPAGIVPVTEHHSCGNIHQQVAQHIPGKAAILPDSLHQRGKWDQVHPGFRQKGIAQQPKEQTESGDAEHHQQHRIQHGQRGKEPFSQLLKPHLSTLPFSAAHSGAGAG